jgi:hypothetical protein
MHRQAYEGVLFPLVAALQVSIGPAADIPDHDALGIAANILYGYFHIS